MFESSVYSEKKPLQMSVSSMSGFSKQNQKKMIQILAKKTNFSEAEVEKLLTCHFQIMVGNLFIHNNFTFTLNFLSSLEIRQLQIQDGQKKVQTVSP